MKNKIFTLILCTAIFAASPIFAMDSEKKANILSRKPATNSEIYIEHKPKEIGIHHSGQPSFLLYHKTRDYSDYGTLHHQAFDVCILANPHIAVKKKSKYTTVGFLSITYRDEDAKEDPCSLYINKLEIKEIYRRKGYGESALRIIIKEYVDDPEIKINQFLLNTAKHNKNAIALYEKLGFKARSIDESRYGNSVFMVLPYLTE